MIKLKMEMPGLLSDGCWARLRRTVEQKIQSGEINPALLHKIYLTDQRPVRTKSQNNYYWGVILKTFGDACGMELEEVHSIFKRMFAGYEMRPFPGGKRRKVEKSTTAMNTKEMSEYIEKCIMFCAQNGVPIPEPNAIPDGAYLEMIASGAIKN